MDNTGLIVGGLTVYNGSTSTTIPALPSTLNGGARSLNDHGQVVGYSVTSTTCEGWYWSARPGLIDLTTQVPVGWYIQEATAINNAGQILAYAQYNNGPGQYVLLDPVQAPEPGTWALLDSR